SWRPGSAQPDQATTARCRGDRGDGLRNRAVSSASHEERRLRLRHQTFQPGGTSRPAGASGLAPALEEREPHLARASESEARLCWNYRLGAGDGEALPHDCESRPKQSPGADSWREWHGKRIGGAFHSLLWAVAGQAFHPRRLRFAGSYAYRERAIRL